MLSARLEVAGAQVLSPKPDSAAPSRQIGPTFTQLTAGLSHTCALTTGGVAYCWGWGSRGQLGDGTTDHRASPVAVSDGLTFTQLAAGGYHTCGLVSASPAYCLGNNDYGELSDGSTTSRSSPVRVVGFS
jgi:alpha-tubulin suppressor-like RCC1 family protein